MAVINKGGQEIFFNISGAVDTGSLSKYTYHLFPTGVYGPITIYPTGRNMVGVRSADIPPWFVIKNIIPAKKQVKITVGLPIDDIAVSEDRPYVILRFRLTALDRSNFAEIIGVGWAEGNTKFPYLMYDDDIILGRVIYENGVLTSKVDYSKQKAVDIHASFKDSNLLRVTAYEPPQDKVHVTGNNIFINGQSFEIPDQDITLPPVLYSRQDLIYMDTDGNLKVVSGVDDPLEPTIPQLPSEAYPVAIISRTVPTSTINGYEINQTPLEKYIVIPKDLEDAPGAFDTLVIPPATTAIIHQKALAEIYFIKYYIHLTCGSLVRSYEAGVLNKHTDLSHSISMVLGDRINHDFTATVYSTDALIRITNNELTDIVCRYRKDGVYLPSVIPNVPIVPD